MSLNQPREEQAEQTTNPVAVVTICLLFIIIFGCAIYMQYQKYKIIKKNKNVDFEILEKASFIRSEWSKRMVHPFKGNIIPGWVQKEFGTNYFERTLKFCNSLITYNK